MTTRRESIIEEHVEMLAIRRESIKRMWPKRKVITSYSSRETKENRDLLRWLIEQAKHHKHMIEQVGSLPEMPEMFHVWSWR